MQQRLLKRVLRESAIPLAEFVENAIVTALDVPEIATALVEKIKQRARPRRSRFSSRRPTLVTLQRHGLTPATFESMWAAQKGRCWICKLLLEQYGINIDHCHATGHVRGLLCTTCNTALGLFKDNVEALLRAAVYLMPGQKLEFEQAGMCRQIVYKFD